MEGITYNGENITSMVRRKKVDTSSFVRQDSSAVICVYMFVPVDLCDLPLSALSHIHFLSGAALVGSALLSHT